MERIPTNRNVSMEPLSEPQTARRTMPERIRDDQKPPSRKGGGFLRRALTGVFLLAAVCCGALAMRAPRPAEVVPADAVPVSHAGGTRHLRTKPIQDIGLGNRLLGNNPVREQVESLREPDPETSRELVLRMGKESGHRLDVRLIRSLAWIESVGAVEGESFFLNLEEMGAVGDAYVEAIRPCPPIGEGKGNVVTGVFAHEADSDTRILSVRFSDGAYLEGVTDNHPFWSVDRSAFAPIGEMKEGDWVKTASGLAQITKIDSRFARSGEMLYNLETHNEHVFRVSLSGILVHNSCVHITLGLGRHLDEFTDRIRKQVDGSVEAFPFLRLTTKDDGPWEGVRRAIHSADSIHFNMKGVTKEKFQAWMKGGGHRFEPYLGGPGWTNRELYEILSNPTLRAKTTFHNLVGGLDDWLLAKP